MATPDAASADLKPIFAAALQGNLSAITANIADANAATADGYTPLQLAVSAGQEQAAALLLREGVSVNAADNTGVTALMHAAMHGHSGIVDTLLLHGADARLKRADGQTAVGLAAAYGRPASLGALFRADPSLLEARDGAGRTAFHWAAASRHETTLKYLLGRWWVNGALAAVDGEGDTPLHLCRGPPRLLFLLCYGGGATPPLDAVNRAGLTPADAIAAAGVNGSLAEAVREAANDDERPPAEVLARWQSRFAKPSDRPDARLFSFLRASPLRVPPPKEPPPRAWCARATGGAWLRGGVSLAAPLLLCASPRLFLALPFVMVPALVAARCCCPQRLGGCLDDGQHGHGHGGGAHHGHHHHRGGAPHRRHDAADGVDVDRTPALLLCGFTALELALHAYLVLPQALREAPTLAALSLLSEACLVAAYISLVTADPGFVAGGDDTEHGAYWSAVEALPLGQSTPSEFDERSEVRRPPRAKHSRLYGAMVRVFDHDCIWIGSAVGGGNHRSFLAMILSGEAALLSCGATLLQLHGGPGPLVSEAVGAWSLSDVDSDGAQDKRLLLLLVLLWALLTLMLTPLAVMQSLLAARNVTTWELAYLPPEACVAALFPPHARKMLLVGGDPDALASLAPYDRGLATNLRDFLAARRDGAAPARVDGDDELVAINVQSA